MLSEDSGNGADEVRPRRENELCAEVRRLGLMEAWQTEVHNVNVRKRLRVTAVSSIHAPSHTQGPSTQRLLVFDTQSNELIEIRQLDQPNPPLSLTLSKRNRLATSCCESIGDTPEGMMLIWQAQVERHTADKLRLRHVQWVATDAPNEIVADVDNCGVCSDNRC